MFNCTIGDELRNIANVILLVEKWFVLSFICSCLMYVCSLKQDNKSSARQCLRMLKDLDEKIERDCCVSFFERGPA